MCCYSVISVGRVRPVWFSLKHSCVFITFGVTSDLQFSFSQFLPHIYVLLSEPVLPGPGSKQTLSGRDENKMIHVVPFPTCSK